MTEFLSTNQWRLVYSFSPFHWVCLLLHSFSFLQLWHVFCLTCMYIWAAAVPCDDFTLFWFAATSVKQTPLPVTQKLLQNVIVQPLRQQRSENWRRKHAGKSPPEEEGRGHARQCKEGGVRRKRGVAQQQELWERSVFPRKGESNKVKLCFTVSGQIYMKFADVLPAL